MDFIYQFIASIFAKFRVKNPLLGGIVVLGLSAISYTTTQGAVLGLFPLTGWLQTAVAILTGLLAAITAPEVYPTLSKAKEK